MRTVRAGGFTLVELMVALLVLALLVVVSAPGLSNLIKNNRMLAQVYAMRAALNGARSEAIAQRSPVTFCRSEDGATCSGGEWNKGYIAFLDADRDGEVDDANNPQILVAREIDVETLDITYSSAGDEDDPKDNVVQFDSQGYARDTNGTFTICDDRDAEVRGVIVTPVGVVRSLDPNDPISCT